MEPSFLIYQVTVRCNSKCRMCSIWQLEPGDELTLEEFDKVLQDPFMRRLRWVNLTGGEPFLRKDLPDMIGALARRSPGLEIVAIPTNGFLPDRTEEMVARSLELMEGSDALLSVTVSIDGVESVHDDIRCIPGGFDKAMDTLERLQAIEHPRFETGVETVITALNVGSIEETYGFFKERTDHVNITPAVVSDYYSNEEDFDEVRLSKKDIERMLAFLEKVSKEAPAYAYYFDKVQDIYRKGRRTYPCLGCYSTMMLSATGDVYPCLMLGGDSWRMGNVRDGPVEGIWCSKAADGIRSRIAKHPYCEQCTNNCDIMANLKEETWNFATWMALHPRTFFDLLRYIREKDFAKKFV
jgi:radical SAM protein with 4Fe4S-binding SPASM domain